MNITLDNIGICENIEFILSEVDEMLKLAEKNNL